MPKNEEAIIIDPPRHFEQIIKNPQKTDLEITAAAGTHIHADYVSKTRQLPVKYNVKLYLSDEGDKDSKHEYTKRIKSE